MSGIIYMKLCKKSASNSSHKSQPLLSICSQINPVGIHLAVSCLGHDKKEVLKWSKYLKTFELAVNCVIEATSCCYVCSGMFTQHNPFTSYNLKCVKYLIHSFSGNIFRSNCIINMTFY